MELQQVNIFAGIQRLLTKILVLMRKKIFPRPHEERKEGFCAQNKDKLLL